MRLFDVLDKRSVKRILLQFLENPTAEMRIKDIVSTTKMTKVTVLHMTKELAKREILLSKHVGRTKLYSLNKGNPTVKQLKILYNIDYINSRLFRIGGEEQVFLYGSFARGDNTEKSDIDLLVIGKDRKIIAKLAALDKRIKVSFYTPLEWSMVARKDKAFFEGVEKDKIRLV